MQFVDDSCVGGDLCPKFSVLCSELVVGPFCVLCTLFKLSIGSRNRTEFSYRSVEFLRQICVLVGKHPSFDARLCSELQNGERPS
jgi:hypothetical protein